MGDLVAALIWRAMQLLALVGLVYLAVGFDWLTGWFSFSPWAGL